MDAATFRAMAAHEDEHWWFVGRRAVIRRLLKSLDLPPEPQILEAGCGTGGNLSLLSERGRVSAFEPNDLARSFAQSKSGVDIHYGELPHRLPFTTSRYDLVVALDVLEHIERDREAFDALLSLVRPGGYVLVTVPAIKRLYGRHDGRLGHFRRYDRRSFGALADNRPVSVEYFGYFNTALMPIAVTLRALERVCGADFGDQERMPPPLVNRMLSSVFSAERHLVKWGLPFGLSMAMITRRNAE